MNGASEANGCNYHSTFLKVPESPEDCQHIKQVGIGSSKRSGCCAHKHRGRTSAAQKGLQEQRGCERNRPAVQPAKVLADFPMRWHSLFSKFLS